MFSQIGSTDPNPLFHVLFHYFHPKTDLDKEHTYEVNNKIHLSRGISEVEPPNHMLYINSFEYEN